MIFSGRDLGYGPGNRTKRKWTNKELSILQRVSVIRLTNPSVSQYWLVKAALGILREFKFDRSFDAVQSKMRKQGQLYNDDF